MRILLATHVFLPQIGGIEVMSGSLAHEFTLLGHDVKVVTPMEREGHDEFPYDVVRRPSSAALLGLGRWCDVCFHNNICLQMAWPLAIVRRPWVIAHQTWLADAGGRIGPQNAAKRFVLRYARNIAVSRAVAERLPVPSTVIGNSYQHETFRVIAGSAKSGDLVFVGRLVPDKGAHLLLEALSQLKARSLTPSLTIVGGGPALSDLQALVHELGLEHQVVFAGPKPGEEIARLLNAHNVLIVPSQWEEPFGIVALEGIACGCVVVGSAGGGLKDAIGAAGITFPNGDATALAQTLERLLTQPGELEAIRAQADAHLRSFRADVVAKAYLEVFERAIGTGLRAAPSPGAV